ncbi:hypothetical protein cd3_007 [Carnobacterium phage cd3]|uniref:Uncharacterized protein n=2 Tax=Carnodivirus TaxID=3044682 RepID=A0AAE7VIX9_9CAUD|nr:hypothetical protein PQD68_gp007 [Carnobacterium phage cd2]YP_010676473.1 hypothetical protein PQD69_gp007 [Carnobacterium phage cd4]QXP45133.1 hypothetical protein cd2_007 [Carnobacterium phage cd2]QXP45311.1 hypothetical protein cd3_007 [Carnobacterium phage cd3]QXP45394.1 hypothetical protein cd4_007 [Carnobacterium phage cd4]
MARYCLSLKAFRVSPLALPKQDTSYEFTEF